MTAPTQPVTITLADFGGPARAGITVTARMSGIDFTAAGVIVDTVPVTGVTDATGTVVLNCFPNAPSPTGLGTKGTTTTFTAQFPSGKPLKATAQIPNAPCNLVNITTDLPAAALTDAQAAVLQAQSAAATATTQATTATGAAATATTQAGTATTQAGIATTQAGIATAQAGSASTSATNAEASRQAIDQRDYPGLYAVAPTTRPPEGTGAAIQNGDSYKGTDGYTYVRVAAAWVNQTAAAAASALTATNEANAAHADRLQSDADAASTAADRAATANYAAAAATVAKFYDTIALGNAGVADAATFGVKAGGADSLARPSIYRRESAGVSTLLYSVLSASEYDARFGTRFEPGVAYAISDANNNAVFLIYDDGTIRLTEVTVDKINGLPGSALAIISALTSTVEIAAFSVADSSGIVPFEILADGTVHLHTLTVDATINGISAASIGSGATAAVGNFSAELIYFDNNGQSLGEGSYGNTGLTTAQEFDNIGFPALSNSPAAYLPLTVANTQAFNPPGTGRGESPMYGALAGIKERIAVETGLSYTDHKYQLLACNNAEGGSFISQHVKGSANYTTVMSQVAAAMSIAQAEGRTFKVGAKFWTQGESYSAGYQAALQQLADDFDADCRGITGQAEPVYLICYQTPTSGSSPALDQLAAHDADSKIFVATPTYFLNFGDGQHIDADSSHLLGWYYGACFVRVAVLGQAWEPLRPLSFTKQGKILTVKYRVPKPPLVLDGVLNAMQPNYGFTMVDSLGNPITINSVTITEPDTVKIVANVTIPAGAVLQYAMNAATGKGPFVGGCGNLRDSQGNTITFRGHAMHNWCVVNKLPL